MKKLLLSLMLVLSAGLFAEDHFEDRFEGQEKILENRLEVNKRTLTDGNVTFGPIEYDVDIYENNALVELEAETFSGDGNWSKFNKEIFDKLMLEIATEVKNTMNNQNINVNISLELDKKIGKDQMVYNKTF